MMRLFRFAVTQVISNYTKKLLSTDPEANIMCGPPQPPSWEFPGASNDPDVSDDESEGDEVNAGDKPVSLADTRKEMEKRMEKKVKRRRGNRANRVCSYVCAGVVGVAGDTERLVDGV